MSCVGQRFNVKIMKSQRNLNFVSNFSFQGIPDDLDFGIQLELNVQQELELRFPEQAPILDNDGVGAEQDVVRHYYDGGRGRSGG